MKVILLQKVKGLGNLGEQVNVKPGYGRNFLVPQNKAVPATKENIVYFEEKRKELEKKAQQDFARAEQRAAKLNDITLVIEAISSDEGKLYGSIGPNEIKDALIAKDIEITKREISMPDGSIHSIGNYYVDVIVHADITAKLQVEIVQAKK